MSFEIEAKLIGVNENLNNITRRLEDVERSVSSLSCLLNKIVEHQEAQTKLLQEIAQASRVQRSGGSDAE